MIRIKNQQGLTLIETIVALAIIAILTLIAVPSLGNLIKKHRISATADNLYYTLQYARSEAVENNTSVFLSFQAGSNWCYGTNINSACNCSLANNCGLGTVNTSNRDIMLAISGSPDNTISFEGSHGAANSSSSITFSEANEPYSVTISISRMGNISMCAIGIAGYTAC